LCVNGKARRSARADAIVETTYRDIRILASWGLRCSVVLCLLSGCGATLARRADDSWKLASPYAGVQMDLSTLSKVPGCGPAEWFTTGPAVLVDLPFTWVADVLLLPVEAFGTPARPRHRDQSHRCANLNRCNGYRSASVERRNFGEVEEKRGLPSCYLNPRSGRAYRC
jgi:uncharacterized protein YceK